MSPSTEETIHNPRLLRIALIANGIFSGLSGLTMLIWAGALSRLLGLTPPALLAMVGAGLLIYAGVLGWLVSRQVDLRRYALGVVGLDLLWVLGSAALFLQDPFGLTTGGKWTIVLVADVVGAFAALQAYSIFGPGVWGRRMTDRSPQ